MLNCPFCPSNNPHNVNPLRDGKKTFSYPDSFVFKYNTIQPDESINRSTTRHVHKKDSNSQGRNSKIFLALIDSTTGKQKLFTVNK